jgi:acetyl-CoA acetyltransferase
MMGNTAENVARQFGIDRARWTRSRCKATSAPPRPQAGQTLRRGDDAVRAAARLPRRPVAADDGVRSEQTLEALAKLRPVFDKRQNGDVTVGNSCQVTDGAVAMLCMSVEEGEEPRPRTARDRARHRRAPPVAGDDGPRPRARDAEGAGEGRPRS